MHSSAINYKTGNVKHSVEHIPFEDWSLHVENTVNRQDYKTLEKVEPRPQTVWVCEMDNRTQVHVQGDWPGRSSHLKGTIKWN